jgi:hypothetical protein
MKRNLIYTLIAGFLVLGILSFTFIKEKPVVKKEVTKAIKAKKTICDASILPLTASDVVWTPSGITITWHTTNNNYDHFNYGGYGVVTPGTTWSNSKSYGFGGVTSRFGVLCACAGGGTSGNTHGVLFSSSGYSLF